MTARMICGVIDEFIGVWLWPLLLTAVAIAASWCWPALKYRAMAIIVCAVFQIGWWYIGLPLATRGSDVVPDWWTIVGVIICAANYVALVILLIGIVYEERRRKRESVNNGAHDSLGPRASVS